MAKIHKLIDTVKTQAKQRKSVIKSQYARVAAGIVAAVVVFGLGVSVGDGRISLNSGSMNGNLPSSLNYSSVNQVYQLLRQKYDGKLTETQLLNGMKAGLAESTGDPYT